MSFHDKKGPGVSAEAAQHGILTENHLAPADPRTGPLFTLAAAGYELIPIEGKAPVGKGWTSAPPLTAKAAAARLAGDRNVGVRLRNTQVVVDWDPRDPEATPDGLDRFRAEFGLDTHPHVETGGGGVHLYLTVPAGLGVKNATKWRPGIDIKTVGGQVVAPGSIHPETGRPYVLHGDPLDDRVDQPAPSALIEALPKHVAAEGTVSVAGKHTPDELEDSPRYHLTVRGERWGRLARYRSMASSTVGTAAFLTRGSTPRRISSRSRVASSLAAFSDTSSVRPMMMET